MTPRVLLIDDNIVNLKIYERLAQKLEACEAFSFTSSSAALEWLENNPVDLVVVDHHMPAPNGLEFLCLLRGMQGKGSVPALMVTADHSKELRYEALESGVTDFLTKPLDFTEFLMRAKNMLALSLSESRILKRADQLQESEQRYRFLADTMPQIVWTARPDGNLDYYNQRWYDYTGLTFEQTKDWGWKAVLHPSDLQNCVQRWTRSFQTGAHYEVQYRFRRESDGAYRWHLGRAFALRDRDGAIVQWVGTCTDIDDQKRAEDGLLRMQRELETRVERRTEELSGMNGVLQAEIAERKLVEAQLERQADALESKNDEIENLFHTVSHELKTPLTSAVEFISLVRDELAGPVTETQREYLGIAKDGCAQLSMCINDLLDASSVDTGKLRVHRILLAPSKAIGRMVASLAPLARGKDIDVTSDIDADLPEVLIDERRIRQVVTNLFNNALKFAPPGGTIHFSATSLTERDDSWVRISVSDSGPGLSAEHATHVFERLYQVRRSALSTEGGLGLGLFISKGIVELHEGAIWVDTLPGQGCNFCFTLPVRKAQGERLVSRPTAVSLH
ncbi:MAG: response regulator [Candidatus Eremiobacteraeota bacterium]|nr:response regulator [Candidatus Eremiobacteraeota bacterium]MBC5828364.1 response regulator [Candidatus Eremiobacteraeota bacterium]